MEDLTPRELLEHRAERAIIKIPIAAAAILISILLQMATGVWFAATVAERIANTDKFLQVISNKVDDLTQNRLTLRDIEALVRAAADHEARLRQLEAQGRADRAERSRNQAPGQ